MNTLLLLEMAVEAAPDRIAIGSRSAGVSFLELTVRARAGGAWLAAQGGELVAFIGLNGHALPTALFASAAIGKPLAPLNYRLADADLRRILARTAPSVAIVDDEMLPRVMGTEGVAIVTRSAFEAACLDPELQGTDLPSTELDKAIILFTSGTTGAPKAAVLRHRHLAAYVVSTVEFMGAEENEAALVCVPPYHIAGMSAVLSGVFSGRRIVYLSAFSPGQWVDAAVSEKITHAMVVPTMLAGILDVLEARGERLPCLRAVSYGGGPMPLPVIERALGSLPHVGFVNAYGLTETSSTIAILDADDHRAAAASQDPAVRRRLASVGRPLPSVELEIRGPAGEALPAGMSGEVYVRGDQIAGEYLHRSLLREDGWFATNDGGWLDAAGYLFVEGRLDDMIVRGGENISPGEIEDVLRGHPAVTDVAVIGLPDAHWGERVAAVVVAEAGSSETELSEWVRTRLRSTKTPQTWAFRAQLPYSDTGKLLRRVLRQELAKDGVSGAAPQVAGR
jgi:acyl-CoA synthetase (AMP-forming)/AMP-acid ligase II